MSTDSDVKDTAQQKQVILDFIKSQMIGVVCTINAEGLPEAATVAISQTDDLELIFQTPNDTRKYTNLQTNPNVAVVLGVSQDNYVTVQYEGVAREVVSDDERARCAAIHDAKKGPGKASYSHILENKFFIVTPTRIRYSDLPNKIFFEVS